MSEPQATRELIQLFQECQWRSSRLQIIRALGQNPTQRSLEFLFKCAQDKNDIPLAETALWSLGQSHHRLAALFLVHLYQDCSEVIKPSIVGALSQIPDRTLVKEFLQGLPVSIRERNLRLAKNLVLTLGELKSKEALPLLQELAQSKTDTEMKLSALISIGKIARNPVLLESLESHFADDLFQYQLFTTVKTQIQFRAKWKLEDYLRKLFETPDFHRTIPFELNHFKSDEVKKGLELYSEKGHFEKLCLALSMIDFPEISDWYSEFFDLSKLNPERMEQVLLSISSHLDARMSKPLSWIRKNRPDCWHAYLAAVACSLPEAEAEFKSFFESAHFKELEEKSRISAINQLYNYGLCIQSNASQLQKVGKILESLLENDPGMAVQGRILRALGGLGIQSKKALPLIKECLKEFGSTSHPETPLDLKSKALLSSVFKYLQLCPERNLLPLLLTSLDDEAKATLIPPGIRAAYLKTLTVLPVIPEACPGLDLFLKACLQLSSSLEGTLAALTFLQTHPRPALLDETISKLKSPGHTPHEEPIQLAAIIALKSFGHEKAVEPVSQFLHLKQKLFGWTGFGHFDCPTRYPR